MPELDHTPDESRRDSRLNNDLIAWLATVRPDGRPHLVPVWFYWTGNELIVTAEPGSQKIKNLRAYPLLSLALDDTVGGKEPIMIEGRAAIETMSDTLPEARGYYDKYRQTMAEMKWSEAESRQSHSVVIRIRIDRFLTF